MRTLFMVILGGALGSGLRYFVYQWLAGIFKTPFPWAVLVINVVACGVLGFLVGIADVQQRLSVAAQAFWTIGFCGGFSTFSAFGVDVVRLGQHDSMTMAALYIFLSVTMSVIVLMAGIYVGKNL